MNFITQNRPWLLPLVFALLITPFTPWLDLETARLFYSPTTQSFATTPLFTFINHYGELPALIVGGAATLFFGYSLYTKKYAHLRVYALVLSLTLGFGCGLFTRLALKELWGRPRPCQVVEFGGKETFSPYYAPTFGMTKHTCQSFPSGHSSTAFYFFCIYFIGRRAQKKWLAWSGLFFALSLGTLYSFCRIYQGGHFLSDTLFSALILWQTSYWVDYFIYQKSTLLTALIPKQLEESGI